jgi:hypothetical protein
MYHKGEIGFNKTLRLIISVDMKIWRTGTPEVPPKATARIRPRGK